LKERLDYAYQHYYDGMQNVLMTMSKLSTSQITLEQTACTEYFIKISYGHILAEYRP